MVYKKWRYWDGIPHVQCKGFEFVIAKKVYNGNWQSCKMDFIYNEVRQALYIAERNNPIFLKKIEEEPGSDWYYSRYLIRNMGNYYEYKKGIYPFNEYYPVLQKLKKELK